MNLDSFALSDIGRTRESNQDAVGCFPEQGLFLVADGMGGLALGGQASRLAVETIGECWRHGLASAPGASAELMAKAIDLANRRIRKEAARQSSTRGTVKSGTTLVALWVEEFHATAHWAHIGDSRLYRTRRGRIELLTLDHTIAGAAHPRGETIPLDLPHTNLLTQALGLNEVARPDSGESAVEPGDSFLLCSDGVSGALPPADLLARLDSPHSAERIARDLIEDALAGGGEDNASVIVVRTTPRTEA